MLAQQGDGGIVAILPPILMMVAIFYFLMWRPQQKQARDHRTMLGALKKGDEIITQGGIVGKVHAVAEKFVIVEVARDVRLRILKSAVQGAVPDGSLAEAEAKAEAKPDREK
jgi:preprotein translocase subunit YajC